VILWPTDLDGAFQGIVAAVKRGEISQSRIDDSVRKILAMKASVGLHQARLVDLDQVSHRLDKQENMDFAQQIAEEAITLVRDSGRVLPLTKLLSPAPESETFQAGMKPNVQVVTVILTDTVRGDWGRAFEKALKARRADATVFLIDNSLANAMSSQILQAVKDAGKVVVAAYVVPTPAKQVMVKGQMVNSVGPGRSNGRVAAEYPRCRRNEDRCLRHGKPVCGAKFSQS